MKKKCVILIPALDPPAEFRDYINHLIHDGFDAVIVVEDGSSDKKIFEDISRYPQVTVLTHEINYGKGKALRTGFDYYRSHFSPEEYSGVITVDSDGQHLVDDVKKLRDRLSSGSQHIILGVRDFDQENVPPKSKFGNKLTSAIFRLFLNLRISDTQTGLRGIPNSLVEPCLAISGDRFEYETAMLIDLGKKAGLEEIKIHTVYYDKNEGTHFHPIRDSIRIYRLLFGTFFRYLLSSLSAFLVDICLFALGTKILFRGLALYIPVSTVFARVFSGIYNYLINRNMVFKSRASYAFSGFSYLSLCILQMAASAALVSLTYHLLPLDEVLVKIIIDSCLFLISYQIQKRFIFK